MNNLFRIGDWPLRAKIALLLFVAALVPLALTAYIDIREDRQRLLDHTGAILSARGDSLVGQLDTFHRGYQRAAKRLAMLPRIVEFAQAGQPQSEDLAPIIREVFDAHISSDSNLRGVAILHLDGKIKLASEEPLNGVDVSNYSFIREAMAGAPVISDIHLAPKEVGFAQTVAYLAPILSPNHQPLAIAAVWVRQSALEDVMKASNELAGPRSFAVLFDSDGIRIAHTYSDEVVFHPGGTLDSALIDALATERRFGPHTRELLTDVRPFAEQFDRARAAQPDTALFRGIAPVNNSWSYGVGRRFDTVPWTVFYMIPEQSLLTQTDEMTYRKVVFATAIMVFAVLAGALLGANILVPIRSLAKATEAIAAGDLAARAHGGRADELGLLSTSFNAMAERIQAQSLELQRAHDDLEVRVRARTAELLKTGQSLRQSEAQLRTIVESLTEGVIVSDLQGNLLHFNRAAQEMHRFTTLEECLRPLADFTSTFQFRTLDGTFVPLEQWPLAQVLRDGKITDLELRVQRLGTDWERIISYGGTIVRDSRGDQVLAIVTCRDITERTRQEEVQRKNLELEEQRRRADQANRLKSEFLANMSHELRTPLNAIIGFSELMHTGKTGPLAPMHQEFLGDILSSARHLLQLINDVLDLAKIESGKMEFRAESVELPKLVGEVNDVLRGISAKRRIKIVTALDESIGPVCLDPGKLKQVLYNYLSNALKFSPENSEVAIRTLPEGPDFFRIEVTDHGAGIGPEDIERLFIEFQQLDSSEGKRHQGTGLGLALTKRIAQAQGGHVGVRSELGWGSTFFAVLPRAFRGDLPSGEHSRTPDSCAIPRMLVVEDDGKDLRDLLTILRNTGCALDSVQTGKEAIALCNSRKYNAITLDLFLPDMNGTDVLNQIRVAGPNCDTPVIVVTLVESKELGVSFHVHDVLTKPVDADALLKSLARAGMPRR